MNPRVLWTAFAVVWAIIAYTTMFNLPYPPTPGLDRSWQFYLSYAAVHHLQFGRDLAFTLGPLGYIMSGAYLPGLNGQIWYAFLFPAAVIAAILAVANRTANWYERIVFVLAAGFTATFGLSEIAMLLLAWAVLAGRLYHPGVTIAMGLIAGTGALMKVDWGLDCAALYILAAALSSRDRATLVRTALTYVWAVALVLITFFDASAAASVRNVLCVAAGGAAGGFAFARIERFELAHAWRRALVPALAGSLIAALTILAADGDFASFIGYSIELLRGYSAAMSVAGDLRVVAAALVLGAAIAAVLVRVAPERRGIAVALGVATFLFFKHGFVRQDTHPLGYFEGTTIVAAVSVLLARDRLTKFAAAAVVLAALAATATVELSIYKTTTVAFYNPLRAINKLVTMPEAVRNLLATDTAGSRSGLASELLPASLKSQLRPGTVAVLPWEINLLYANDLPMGLPPIPQLYTAYTGPLDASDRDWFASDDAPPNVLYNNLAIDGRYPLAEAPSTIMELWCRYRWVADGKVDGIGYSLLHRTAGTCAQPATVMHRYVRIGQPFALPAAEPGQAIAAHIHLKRNLFGALAETLFRLDPVTARVTDEGGTVTYRIVPGVAQDGIILQPLVATQPEFAAFFAGRTRSAPEIVQIDTANRWLYDGKIEIELDLVKRAAGP